MSSLWDEEDQLRRGDEYNEKLRNSLRCGGATDEDIDKLMNPLERHGKDKKPTRQ